MPERPLPGPCYGFCSLGQPLSVKSIFLCLNNEGPTVNKVILPKTSALKMPRASPDIAFGNSLPFLFMVKT